MQHSLANSVAEPTPDATDADAQAQSGDVIASAANQSPHVSCGGGGGPLLLATDHESTLPVEERKLRSVASLPASLPASLLLAWLASRFGGGGGGIISADDGEGLPASPSLRRGRMLAGVACRIEFNGAAPPLAAPVAALLAAPPLIVPLAEPFASTSRAFATACTRDDRACT